MRRYALRDDQWDRIKDFLPGREGYAAARQKTIACSSKRCSTAIERAVRGVICPSGSARGNPCTNGSAGGRKQGSSSAFLRLASDRDNEYMMIDATIVRAHQHSAGAQKKTARKPSADPAAD